MWRRRAALAVALGVALLPAAVGAAEPPPVERLFGCPLLTEADGFEPRRGWRRVDLDALGVTLRVPGRWAVEESGARASLASSSGRTSVVIRRDHLGGQDLERVKRMVEARELGPSHAGERCARTLAQRIAAATGLERVLVGVYGRPLTARRRSYALFVGLADATLTVVLTAQWPKRAAGPDLEVVRRVLGGLRVVSPPPG